MQACKEKGLVRQEGKEYVVKDGDIIVFRFNVQSFFDIVFEYVSKNYNCNQKIVAGEQHAFYHYF